MRMGRIMGVAFAIAVCAFSCLADVADIDTQAYQGMIRRLRAFYPDEGHMPCKDPRQLESSRKIQQELQRWSDAHPGHDALDLRVASYEIIQRHFVPFLFLEDHPFYFEAGINGGWSLHYKTVPGRHVKDITSRFYLERHLASEESLRLLEERGKERMTLVGPFVDDQHQIAPFHTIFTKGFGGVKKDVLAAIERCPANDPLGRRSLEAAVAGLDAIHGLQLKFAAEAERQLASGTLSPVGERNARRVIESASRCPWEPPRNFYEGLNTLWFIREIMSYAEGLCIMSLGRPDAWLIDFYRRDVAEGRLTEAEAKDMMIRFLLVADCHQAQDFTIRWDTNDQESEIPVSIGGCDVSGRPIYNELTRLILDAHLAFPLVFPKVHVRISRDTPQELLEHVGSMLMANHAVFTIFNDDRIIEQFLKLGVPLDRARDYTAMGCYDPHVDSWMDIDGDNYVSVARALELTINPDPDVEKRVKVHFNPIDGAKDFEEVKKILYGNVMRMFRAAVSDYTRYGRINAQVFPWPVYTVCIEGGIESRRDVWDGGVRLIPRIMTLAFLANMVDSMCAIDRVCFKEKLATLPEFLAAVRSNWKGPRGEELRQAALDSPCWGDNSEESNSLMRWWIDSVSDEQDGQVNDRGGPYVLATWVYREFLHWSANARATPDGRRDGDQYAQGFSPSELRCKSDITTVFNAIGSLDHTRLYCSNANLAFEKSSMSPAAFAAVFRVFCMKDMHILQPNCFSVEDLLDAQVHPERHHDIIIRVCGYSARFTALSKPWQDEIIRRHRLK